MCIANLSSRLVVPPRRFSLLSTSIFPFNSFQINTTLNVDVQDLLYKLVHEFGVAYIVLVRNKNSVRFCWVNMRAKVAERTLVLIGSDAGAGTERVP